MTSTANPSSTTAAPVGQPAAARWLGLDALRGLSMLLMILVNNPGAWGAAYQYAPLRHAEWHGCTPTDLVFPTFLFCAGVAIVPALSKKLAHGAARGPLLFGIGKRTLWLVLIGLSLPFFSLLTATDGKPFEERLAGLRFPGVLQRIGVCYGLAALLFVTTSERVQRLVLFGCLVGSALLMTCVAVPGVGWPDLAGPMTTLQGWLDRAVFGAHIYKQGPYDPEGLLSTIPALATALLGVHCGRVLQRHEQLGERIGALLRLGCLWMLAGAVWGWFLPINKPLWTPSYALWTGGIAAAGLGLCVWAFEQRGWQRWARPLQVYGLNALLVFVGSNLLARVLSVWKVDLGGKQVDAKTWFFRECLLAPIGDPHLASLAFGVVWVLGWYAVLAWLYRRNIVWRV
jgi:predicted acyltransferase